MTTVRALKDSVSNALDYLSDARLVLYTNPVAVDNHRVTWHAPGGGGEFLIGRSYATVAQYMRWLEAGEYSAVLPDASLLQMTYDVLGGEVVMHRLAYVPCPTIIEEDWLWEGEGIADVVDVCLGSDVSRVALRSPMRFDYEPAAAGSFHPTVHLSLNDESCRIACVAPMHPYRFLDFVFRHFYPESWHSHRAWFSAAAASHLQPSQLADEHRALPHLAWDLHGPVSGAG
jgi:hypothetical protein